MGSNSNNLTNIVNTTTTLHGVVTSVISPNHRDGSSSHALAYILIPLGSLFLVAVIAFVVMMVFRKNRLDRLRHHLMPLYNFDPQEEDWESELLDDRGRRITYRDGTPSPTSPKLKFNT